MNAHARVLSVVYDREEQTDEEQNIKIIKTAFENAGKAWESVKADEAKELASYTKKKVAVPVKNLALCSPAKDEATLKV